MIASVSVEAVPEGLVNAAVIVLVALVIFACGICVGLLSSGFLKKNRSIVRLSKHSRGTEGRTKQAGDSTDDDQAGVQVNMEADEAQEARRAFTANVSHELKTPLTVISGYAELLKNGLVRSEDINDVSSVIYDEACYMLTLVDDILTLTQVDEYISTGNTGAHAKPVDLAAIAERVLTQLKPFAEQSDIRCTLKTTGDTTVVGLKRLLTSIVYNLSENAIRYNTPGGSVGVEVNGSDGSVQLIVSDTGIGISEEDQPRVFERFYRVDQAHSRHSGGTGLGLAIVKHGSQYHNASLVLQSKPGRGTQVTVRFPR